MTGIGDYRHALKRGTHVISKTGNTHDILGRISSLNLANIREIKKLMVDQNLFYLDISEVKTLKSSIHCNYSALYK